MIVAAGRAETGIRPISPDYPRGRLDNLPPVGTETQTKQLWICTSCGFIYDPDEGDPDGGIPPGTAFEEIPDTWFCPVCGARKVDFEPYED
jgi:rubredoxin